MIDKVQITSADFLYDVALHMNLEDLHVEELERLIAALKENGYPCFTDYLRKLDS